MRGVLRTAYPIVAALLLALAACSSEETPFLELRGGGFAFNYRIAEATMTLVAVPLKALPDGSVVEATFTDPAGGPPIVLTEKANPTSAKFDFTTPALKGIVAGKEYPVTLRLVAADGRELQKIEKDFHSELDQSVLPDKPLVVGPVYTPNPELKQNGGG